MFVLFTSSICGLSDQLLKPKDIFEVVRFDVLVFIKPTVGLV